MNLSQLAWLAIPLLPGLAVSQDFYVSTTGNDANNGSLASPWRTVTHAAANATSGSTIHVAAGTYGTAGFLEGIEIRAGKKLAIAGDGIGETVLQANSGFSRTVPYRTGTRTWSGIFVVHGAGTLVDLRDMTLDAMHLQPSFLACALYSDGAGGTIERVEMRNAGADPANGAQGHVGFVAAGKNAANPSSVHLIDCWIHHWNKVGVVLSGAGLTGSITGCTVTGSGRLGDGKAAQNGIQLGVDGGGFVVRNNVIRNVWYVPSRWNAVGILVYDTRGASPNIISGNRILACKTAYYLYTPTSGTSRFDGNRTGNCQWGINVWSDGGSARNNVFDADVSIAIVSASAFPIDGNAYSDFRTNAGWPAKYLASGNSAIQDLNPNTDCIGFQDAVGVPLAFGAGPRDLVTGDFNGDSKPDFAVANATNNTVSVHFGSGGTDFTTIPKHAIAVPGGPSYLTTGELDGRAGLDLAVAAADGNVYVLSNNGSGAFTRGTPFDLDGAANDAQPSSIAAGQIDGRLQDDLVIGLVGDRVFKNGGVTVLHVAAGNLTAGAAVPGTVRSIRGVALGDFDKNGKLDLAAVDESNNIGTSDKLQVWLHSATTGTFSPPASYSITMLGRGIALGDLDGDSHLDCAVTCSGRPGLVHVFEGSANGTFTPAAESFFRVDTDAFRAAILDLQSDSDPDTLRMDLAVLHSTTRKVERMKSYVRGGFADFLGCPTGLDPTAFAFAQLNGDGLPDLLVANRGDSKVTVTLARPDALAQSFGEGCAGTGGRVPRIFADGLPRLGNAGFQIGVQNARGWSIGVLLLTANRRSGASCELLVDLPILLILTALTNGDGIGTTPFPIPNVPALAGIDFFGQWAIFDDQGQFFGNLSLSDGMRLRTGY